MEACGGLQHWARSLLKLGHEVKLLSGHMVKPFVGGNKNDAADARGIWTAVQQPEIKAVAVKSEEQQALLALHRMREQLVKFRTAQINGLRGLLTEYSEVMPQGRAGIKRDIPGVTDWLGGTLSCEYRTRCCSAPGLRGRFQSRKREHDSAELQPRDSSVSP